MPRRRKERAKDQPSLIIEVEHFLVEMKMPASKMGTLAVSDPRLVQDLRLGRVPGDHVRAKVSAFMCGYRLGSQQSENMKKEGQGCRS